MAITASQILTKFTNISTATTVATLGSPTASGPGYIPSASTIGQVYGFSVSNNTTVNKRAYVDIFINDGAGNSANLVSQMPVDPGASKGLNAVSKIAITSSGFLSGAISATTAPCSFVFTIVEVI